MRCIRTNQIMKSLYKNEMWRYKDYKDSRRVRNPQNVTIAYGNKTFANESGLDHTFKWHSEAVSSNFWSNWRKSCVSFDYKSSHPNAVGMATKYLPTKERN
ncbi:hypothetical protein [Bacillus mycoides]|uniref:hypothetical protein n=1 Tax=Bacillus mycoides TaxID=1405 RepID=UPI0025A165D0|nr:hypothetical protein [Bacillus mycoides]MDM5430875.1 hypothetical protein [Bacillus mycoides]